MAYNYYQTGTPGWGTSQYRFGPPRTMNFQPQPGWGGMDFYRSYAGQHADPNLWNNAWGGVRDYQHGSGGSMGVGLHEARHWHRKAYAYGEVQTLSPMELGHAAAYEAYRTWIHNRPMYEPLSGDYERQREGLVGIAVAEATELSYLRPWDQYGRQQLTEAAAGTANILFWESKEREQEEVDLRTRGRSRSRAGSAYAGTAFGGSAYGGGSAYDDVDDPYAVDEVRRRGRSRSRHRSYSGAMPIPGQGMGSSQVMGSAYNPSGSAYGTPASAYGTPGSAYGATAAGYGAAASGYGGAGSYSTPGSYGTSGSYGASAYGTPAYGAPYNATPGAVMTGSPYMAGGSSSYGQQVGQAMQPIVIPSSNRSRSRHRSSSFSMPYTAQGQYGAVGYPGATAAQPMVVVQSSKHHKHKRSRSKHRSHSHSRF